MSQTKQVKKIKKYRVLKVVFYSLGLPLFMFATLLTAIRFIGHDPFVGTAAFTGTFEFFMDYESTLTSSALYGLWIAVGVWLLISILHLILSKTVKSRKARMVAVTAIILVVMMGGVVAMDAAFTSKVNAFAEDAPAGVSVQDYKTQLSYYRVVSSVADGKSLTKSLLDRVAKYEEVYHVKDYYGKDMSGTAGNIANKPVTYGMLIHDEGKEAGVTVEGRSADELVRVEPNADGKLQIGDEVFNHYEYVERKGTDGESFWVWYMKDMQPTMTEGEYGKGLYNQNGLMSDGWQFSFENVLSILENYYDAQAQVSALEADLAQEENLAAILETAEQLKEAYYTTGYTVAEKEMKAADWEIQLYGQEEKMAERFSMTPEELDVLFSQIVALLGNNSLFDYVFDADANGIINSILSFVITTQGEESVFDQLKTTGLNLTGMAGEMVNDIVGAVAGKTVVGNVMLKLAYDKYLTVTLADDKAAPDETLLTIEFTDAPKAENRLTLETLNTYVNNLVKWALDKVNSVDSRLMSLVNMFLTDVVVDGETYKGLEVAGFQIPLMTQNGEVAVNLKAILSNILGELYYYQSPVIKHVSDFYVDAAKTVFPADAKLQAWAEQAARLYRATYTGATYGTMIGSTLIGDTLGTGNYSASVGLTNLTEVQQLIWDLKYQPVYFPIYAVRDMMFMFSGLVIVFYLLSFLYAEKEEKAMKMLLAYSEDTATPVKGNN